MLQEVPPSIWQTGRVGREPLGVGNVNLYARLAETIEKAVTEYAEDVRGGTFPKPEADERDTSRLPLDQRHHTAS
jgi:hypothetical protein